jgi:hypothetical protein
MVGQMRGSWQHALENRSTVFERIKKAVDILTAGVIKFAFLLYLYKWVFAFIILGGIALVALRAAIIALMPWLLTHIKIVKDFANSLVDAIDVLRFVTDIEKNAIREIEHFVHLRKHDTHIYYKPLQRVSMAEISQALIEVGTVCTPMNNAFKVAGFMIKESLNQYVCPAVRAVQPTVFAGVARTLTSFLVYAPVNPEDGSSSCMPPVPPNHAWFCAAFGSGFILLEIVFPALVVGLFVYALIVSSKKRGK